jgi:hypothetical protein
MKYRLDFSELARDNVDDVLKDKEVRDFLNEFFSDQ